MFPRPPDTYENRSPDDLPRSARQETVTESCTPGIRCRAFDTSSGLQHPSDVLILSRRLSALLLTIALAVSHATVCAGWLATPETRMACCSDGGACPMHKSESAYSNPAQSISQAEADSCCAASEGDQSSQSSSTFASTISLAVLGTPSPLPVAPDVAMRQAGTAAVPLPPSHVPKHVLHSVFLV
jgi:hypothetical protein